MIVRPIDDVTKLPVDDLLAAFVSIAALDFPIRFDPDVDSDEMRAVVVGVQMLAEEIEAAISERDEALRGKDRFIASVSHELRTPLTAVMGFAEILKDETSGLSAEDRAEMIRSIAEEGLDLTNIVDDLLTAAMAETGTLNAVHVPVDLRAQTAQVLETWNQQEAGHIELTGSSIRAIGDPARVRQIVRNLISNALKYGGDTIRIEVTSDDTTARVQVCDNGPGILEEDHQRVFEPHQRAHQEPGLTASLGLGLSISRQLASLMGGGLTYRHQPGESIFELTLPAATSPPTSE